MATSFLMPDARTTTIGQRCGEGASKAIKAMEDKITEILAVIKEIKETTLLASKTMLTTSDVSKLTGLSVTQLRNLRSEKRIPYYRKTAKLIYYDRAEIDAWMRQNRVNSIDD